MEDEAEDAAPGAPIVDTASDKGGQRAGAADRAAAERIRNNPPPVVGQPSAPAATPAAGAHSAGAPATAAASLKLVSETPDPSGTKPPDQAGAKADEKPATPSTEERLAALELENKELKAKNGAATPAAPAAPAPDPATAEPSVEEVNKLVKAELAKDAECRTLQSDFLNNDKRLNEIVTFNEKGIPAGGELFAVATRINAIESQLEPEKKGVRGVQPPDEITQEDLRRQLAEARSERERLHSEHDRLIAANERIYEKWDKKATSVQHRITTDAQARRQAETRKTQEREDVQAGHTEWTTAFKVSVPTDLSKDDREWVHTTLLEKANAAFDRGEDIPDFNAWMAKEAPVLLGRIGKREGAEAARLAREKEKVTTPPAPRGAASIATPTSTDNPNLSPQDRRRAAEARTAQMSRRLVLQNRS